MRDMFFNPEHIFYAPNFIIGEVFEKKEKILHLDAHGDEFMEHGRVDSAVGQDRRVRLWNQLSMHPVRHKDLIPDAIHVEFDVGNPLPDHRPSQKRKHSAMVFGLGAVFC